MRTSAFLPGKRPIGLSPWVDHADRIAQAAQKAGLAPSHAIVVESVDRAVETILPLLSPQSHVLVKGSRGMRMERIVEAIRSPS